MPNRQSYQQYTVVKGDTLAAIAKRFGTNVNTIAVTSGIADPNKIKVGQVLSIPVAGDDLDEVVVKARPIARSSPKMPPGPGSASQPPAEIPTISIADYVGALFEPPRVYFTLAGIAAFVYFYMQDGRD